MRAAHLINAAEDSGMMKSGAHWRRRLTKSARARSARSGGLGGPGGLRPRHRAPPPAALERRERKPRRPRPEKALMRRDIGRTNSRQDQDQRAGDKEQLSRNGHMLQ